MRSAWLSSAIAAVPELALGLAFLGSKFKLDRLAMRLRREKFTTRNNLFIPYRDHSAYCVLVCIDILRNFSIVNSSRDNHHCVTG